jgi:hypothetical protein
MTDRNIKGISAFVTLALIEKYFLLGNIFLNSRSGTNDRYIVNICDNLVFIRGNGRIK